VVLGGDIVTPVDGSSRKMNISVRLHLVNGHKDILLTVVLFSPVMQCRCRGLISAPAEALLEPR